MLHCRCSKHSISQLSLQSAIFYHIVVCYGIYLYYTNIIKCLGEIFLITRKLEKTELGRTGLIISRFSAGGHFTNGPTGHEDIERRVKELNYLLDLGVNYFDVQWDLEEIATAKVMNSRKDEFIVAWPLHGVTALGGDLTKEYIIEYCKEHQKRYQINHVNILMWIALELHDDTEQKVMDVVRSAFKILKAEGFCDFLGFSCHYSPDMALRAITEFDDFDVMMIPYSPLHPAADKELLKTAEEKGVGVVGMKPFGGGGGFINSVWSGEVKHSETDQFYQSAKPYQASLRWVLQNKNIDCTVPGAHSIQEIDELFNAVQEEYSQKDEQIIIALKKGMQESNADYQLKNIGKPLSWD